MHSGDHPALDSGSAVDPFSARAEIFPHAARPDGARLACDFLFGVLDFGGICRRALRRADRLPIFPAHGDGHRHPDHYPDPHHQSDTNHQPDAHHHPDPGSHRYADDYPHPINPLGVEVLFESTVTPGPDAIFSDLIFTQGIDEDFQPQAPGEIFQNPVGHLYAVFTYDGMTVGAQWTALWWRGDDLVNFETAPWEAGTGGYGYTDWNPPPEEWLPGEYQVQVFVGHEWKSVGFFTVEGEAPTAEPTATATASATPTPTRTATQTPWPTITRTPTVASQTPYPTLTPTTTNTSLPTLLPLTPTPTLTRQPLATPITPTVTITRWPTPTRTATPTP